ncbi:protein TBATA isoform X2 [Nerophis ophidion]|uniref:protein TBATA isoform X2 n=1 Tax=Nerophis ophidion TaxID=159077 RepID=UPI002AE082D4|nr:protein TBATA isoform X2 [Nerophis ophidion]
MTKKVCVKAGDTIHYLLGLHTFSELKEKPPGCRTQNMPPETKGKRNVTKNSASSKQSQHRFVFVCTPTSGLNGRPVCMVRDDCFVSSSLFPHPLLKSHVHRQSSVPALAFLPHRNIYGVNGGKSAMFSEAWRDELKELAAKVSLPSQAHKDKSEAMSEKEPVRRKTQYSAETGRIIPPTSMSHHRRSQSLRQDSLQAFHDQELTVLEVLCQILQTDSLSAVQQWLLMAGQREKDLVMGMIRKALDGVDLPGRRQPKLQHLQEFHPGSLPLIDEPTRKKPQGSRSHEANRTPSKDKPEMIGDAEVLEIHSEEQ